MAAVKRVGVAEVRDHISLIQQFASEPSDKAFDPKKLYGRGFTALHIVASIGDLNACRRAIELGADPLQKDPDGQNAIENALHSILGRHREVAEYLQSVVEQMELAKLIKPDERHGLHDKQRL